ncbi:hypothetical protein EAO77_28555, partial [Streptomyces sp. t39]
MSRADGGGRPPTVSVHVTLPGIAGVHIWATIGTDHCPPPEPPPHGGGRPPTVSVHVTLPGIAGVHIWATIGTDHCPPPEPPP